MGPQSYLRRLTRRLTEDPERRDVEKLSDEVASTGAQRAIDCQRGQEVTMVGTLRSVEANGRGCSGGVRGRDASPNDADRLRVPRESRQPHLGSLILREPN